MKTKHNAVVAALGALVACSGGESTPQPPPPVASSAVVVADPVGEAKNIYATRCLVCHGPEGKGDGSGAANLDPKPRSFISAEWQAATTDDAIRKIIVVGGGGVGKSPLMPPNVDLSMKPTVVEELLKTVRSFAPKT